MFHGNFGLEESAADLIHGIKEPLRVRGKTLSKLPYAPHHICLGHLISSAPQVINHLVHNDLHHYPTSCNVYVKVNETQQTCASER